MGGKTGIQWTDSTLNIVTGCTRVSAGCDHCYAFQLHDQRHVAWKRGTMPDAAPQYHQPFSQVQLFPERLALPLKWKTPRKIFVCSMGDLFHQDVPDEFIEAFVNVMWSGINHTYQVLTKRPDRMRVFMQELQTRTPFTPWPVPQRCWLGTSVEDQSSADVRIPPLVGTPAAVRFLSMEPLLGPVDIATWMWSAYGAITWVILGGESGPHARPCDPDWIRSLIAQAHGAGAAVFVKQLGTAWAKEHGARDPHGGDMAEWPEDLRIREFPS